MNVNLTPELERLVQAKVSSGLYNNQSEVVRESLRQFFMRERAKEDYLDYLRASIAEGLSQAERGDLVDGESALDEISEELHLD